MTTPIPIRPSRAQRRAAEAIERKANSRARSHGCVLQRDAVAAGVSVRIEHEAAQHKFHTARGEPVCPACPVCARFRQERRKPTRFTLEERRGLVAEWNRRLACARDEPYVAELVRVMAQARVAVPLVLAMGEP